MSNYTSGHSAERDAAEYLRDQGFSIRDMNWKTKYCEIDIIAEKRKIIYFVEVKSRKNSRQGYGYDYVTPTKQKQMGFAAEIWVQENAWRGEYQLSVISIDAGVITFFESIGV
jgi:Holliday junction resolvase-like predicted endonuclease